MIIQDRPVFDLKDKRMFAALVVVFGAGLLVCIAGLLGLLYLAGALLNLAIDVWAEVAVHIASVYASGDSAVKLAIWLIALLSLCKASPHIAHLVHRSLFHKVTK